MGDEGDERLQEVDAFLAGLGARERHVGLGADEVGLVLGRRENLRESLLYDLKHLVEPESDAALEFVHALALGLVANASFFKVKLV